MTMGKIVLDTALREKLNGLSEQMEVHNEKDEVVGVFLPMSLYKYLLRTVPIPFSADEIERRRQEKGGCSLEEIWQRIGAK
jgi:hypothetical protein